MLPTNILNPSVKNLEHSPTLLKNANLPVINIDGESYPHVVNPDNLRSAKQYVPHSSDVFVCTFPRSGTTWIQHICSQLMFQQYDPDVGKELCITSPLIEYRGVDFVNSLEHPRLLKTHFTYWNCPKSQDAKYIYSARNPKDVLTSYYFHHKNFKLLESSNVDFDSFFDLFLSGQLAYGDYFAHLLSWLPHCHHQNILFVKYEEILADLRGNIIKIGNFIGGRAAEQVNCEEDLDRIVSNSSFGSMKKDQYRWFPQQYNIDTFIRQGNIRDWKNYMSRQKSDQLDQLFKKKLFGTEAQNWWTSEMDWQE